jgi:hypothetical protein
MGYGVMVGSMVLSSVSTNNHVLSFVQKGKLSFQHNLHIT